ncbi:MAG TPA: LCP family protein [Acidimicrobiales bacterium]|nr:LCP family protein [Acidimicrobiales bacterium]
MATDEVVDTARARRWPRRLLIGANVFVALVLLVTAGGYWYLKRQVGSIDVVPGLCEVLRNCGDDDPGQAMNVLLVGSDSRKDLAPGERQFGTESQVGGQRSDTILVLHADPKERKASILSIPRDLAVPIAGARSDQPQRINTAFEQGPQSLIATIRQSLGIEIDHYAQVDFNGFRGVVEAVGGVTIFFPSPVRDKVTGLNVKTPGCVELDGNRSLAYVRSREYEYVENGRWRADPTGDLGRISRQQDFIRRVIRKASRAGRNPVTLDSLVDTAVRNVRLDERFSTADIIRLSRRFKSLEPDSVEMLSLPTVDARVGDAAVLRLKQPEARLVIDHFLGREPPPPPPGRPQVVPDISPSRVRVRVLNGSGAEGQAGQAAQALQTSGFILGGTGDAEKDGYTDSVIRYGRGQEDKAVLLRSYIGGGAQVEQDSTLRGVDLVLVTGSTFTGVQAPGNAGPATTGPSTTTTTAPGVIPGQTKGGPPPPPC